MFNPTTPDGFDERVQDNQDLVEEQFANLYPYLRIEDRDPMRYDDVYTALVGVYKDSIERRNYEESEARHAMTEFACD